MGEVRAGPVAGERISVCRLDRAFPSNAFLANLAVNLIVNFIDFRPFAMKFAIKFSTKTSDLGSNSILCQASRFGHSVAHLSADFVENGRKGNSNQREDEVLLLAIAGCCQRLASPAIAML